MNTHLLIEMLARGAGPAPRAAVARRFVPAAALGLLCSCLLALLIIGPLPPEIFSMPAPWIKLAYGASLGVAASWLTAKLARPVAHSAWPVAAVLGVLVAMALAGFNAVWQVPPEDRISTLLGPTWLMCPWVLMAVSLPALAAILWALRGLAPTDLRGAGTAAGVLAGAIGTMGYALACPENSTAFVAVWYTLGIGLTALIGRWTGPRVLQW
jgi:hypothetical protein